MSNGRSTASAGGKNSSLAATTAPWLAGPAASGPERAKQAAKPREVLKSQ